ncbi:Sbal_3080 family lipoprotein [Pseudomonas aeruginosa]|uniref:Sbal_3080 family lipoprotein n=1 Tax=Pseudomonas aeruginosa TaxID=287 RepID=UPI002F3F1F64
MKRTFNAAAGALFLVLLTGCSIKQQVDPATLNSALAPEICLIPASGVRGGFTVAYGDALESKGFTVRTLPAGISPTRCPIATTYTGIWNWDMALYMSFADIRVYENGRQVGKAVYDSRGGAGRPDKFISAESKIAELTDQLFPKGASGLGRTPVLLPPAEQAKLSKEDQIRALQQEGLSYEEYQRRYRLIMGQ